MSFLYYWSKLLKKIRGPAIKSSVVGEGSKIEPGSLFVNSTMGKHSFCGYDCEIVKAEIGSFCSIANNVSIGGGEHPVDWVGTSPVFYKGRDSVRKKFSEFPREAHRKTIIGSDVWIGFRAVVLQGVTVGHGAVIGAGAVVSKDVAPYSIVAGVPARHLRHRFDGALCDALLETRWWELDDDELGKYARFIRDPQQFVTELKR